MKTEPLRPATFLAFALAAIALALWLGHAWCRFPAVVWNDVRLAPAVAFAQGWPAFPTATTGPINTWTYGPLPLLAYLPAALAPTATGALLLAGTINLALTLVPLALVCRYWPLGDSGAEPPLARAGVFLLVTALWAPRHYEVIFADNLAIACGLLGNLVLARARGPRGWWLAALLATAAVGCKQIAVGMPLAQALWLVFTEGWRAGLRHAVRCLLAGALWVGLAGLLFGGAGLWHVLVALPADFPWVPAWARLAPMLPELAWQAGLPLVVMAVARATFATPALLLPALAWACTLPPGLLALLKHGGWLNSVHSLALWLPPVLTILACRGASARADRWIPLAAALAAAVVTGGRIAAADRLFTRPAVAAYAEAEQLAAQFRGRIWFPFHPLVTLYSERRYYHDEDGLHVRRLSRVGTSPEQAAAHLPAALQVMAFHQDWSDWGVARAMLPPGARTVEIGHWKLWLRGEAAARK